MSDIEDEVLDQDEVREEPAFTVLLNGVDVGFRDMNAMQLTMANMITNEAPKRARKIGDAAAAMEMMGKLLNIIEALVIEEEHREHLVESCIAGKIDFPEAYLILRRGEPIKPEDEDPAPVKPKAKKSVAARNRVRR